VYITSGRLGRLWKKEVGVGWPGAAGLALYIFLKRGCRPMSTPMPSHAATINMPGNQGGAFDIMAVILRRAIRPTQGLAQPN
jgi:hypothetical protein